MLSEDNEKILLLWEPVANENILEKQRPVMVGMGSRVVQMVYGSSLYFSLNFVVTLKLLY